MGILQLVTNTMRLILRRTALIFLLGLVLSGCETLQNFKFGGEKTGDKYTDWDVKRFYDNAKKAMDAKNYVKAIELYRALETRYPFSDYDTQIQLNITYAYFKNRDFDDAISAADQFIKVHPRNQHLDYVYYIKGLSNFNRDIGFIDRFLPTDSSQRNHNHAQTTYNNFQELVRLFPDSSYAGDAKQRMLWLRNNLAMYEIHVARFYMKRKAYISAANRANYVIKEYQRTIAVPHALQVMQVAYAELGLDELSATAGQIYQENFPNGIAEPENVSAIHQLWDFIGLEI